MEVQFARDSPAHILAIRRMGIDTLRQPVVFMRADCEVSAGATVVTTNPVSNRIKESVG